MAEIYSPELITAQREFLSTRGNPSLHESTRKKLRYWGITDEQLKRLKRTETPEATMTVTAPRSGTVIKKSIEEGEYVKEGSALFRIADYDSLWLRMDIFQQNSPWVREGQTVTVRAPENPSQTFEGPIEFIDPFYDETLRATQARVTLTSPPDWVVPGKYLIARLNVPLTDVNVEGLRSDTEGRVRVVPAESVLRTGERNVVYVQYRPGQFEPRDVRIGPRARIEGTETEVYPVVSGLEVGEKVVRRGNFLLDSQSRVGSGGGGYSGALEDDEDGEDSQ
jgi:RND family efflux transporter MFP subunit